MKAKLVSDDETVKTLPVFAHGSWGPLQVGTLLEVSEPLNWDGEHVCTKLACGEQDYCVHIGHLGTSSARGVLAEAVQVYLEATAKLDTTKSRVILRSPHHENQPDPSATKSRGTGEFTLSLADFSRQFARVREAIVKKAS